MSAHERYGNHDEVEEFASHRVPSRGALRTILDTHQPDSRPPVAPHVHFLHAAQAATEAASQLAKESLLLSPKKPHPTTTLSPEEPAPDSKESLERLRRMDNFESQDFDPMENDVERATALDRDDKDYVLENFWKWALSVLIGLSCGLAAFIADASLEAFNNWKFGAVRTVVRQQGGFWAPYFTFVPICLMFSGIAGCMVAFGAPTAAGSGIPEIKTYLNGVHIRGLLSMRTLVCKLLGVVCSMAGGLVAGKDLVHTGGAIGGGIAGAGSKALTDLSEGRYIFRLPRHWGGYFRNEADHRDFVAIGMAAGVSSAFSSPVGGLLLMLEEGASFLSVSLFLRGFLATCTGVATLHFLAQLKSVGSEAFSSKYGIRRDLGLYGDDLTNVGRAFYYHIWDLPIFILMGAAAGTLGAAFNHMHVGLVHLRAYYLPNRLKYRRLAEVLVVAWATSTIFYIIIYNGQCLKLPPREQLKYLEAMSDDLDIYAGISLVDSRGQKHFPRLWCQQDEFNEYGQLFFSPFIASMRLIVHFGETMPATILDPFRIAPGPLFLFAVVVFWLMLVTTGLNAPTGILIPAMAIGACMGRILGMLLQNMLLDWGFAASVISLPAYSVIGAAAMFGGVTRMCLFVPLLVMEGTGSLQLIVPLMITTFSAKLAGDSFTLPMFNIQIKIRGAPVLTECGMDERQRVLADKLTVAELVTTQVVALPPVVRLRELISTMRRCKHQAFPITPEVDAALLSDTAFPLHGVVRRMQLLRMVKFRIGIFRLDPNSSVPPSNAVIPPSQEGRYALLGSLEQFPLKIRSDEEDSILSSLDEAELEMVMDLRPFMQRTPFIIHGNASLARAYRLFRTMGLHHLFVGPPKPPVIGVLTRKDVVEETAEVYLHDKCQKGLLPGAAPSSRTADLPHYPFRGSHGGGFGDPQLSPSSQGLQVIELQGVEEAHSDRTEPQGNQEREMLIGANRRAQC